MAPRLFSPSLSLFFSRSLSLSRCVFVSLLCVFVSLFICFRVSLHCFRVYLVCVCASLDCFCVSPVCSCFCQYVCFCLFLACFFEQLEAAMKPSQRSGLVCSAEPPYCIAHVNAAWTELMGHSLEDVKFFPSSLMSVSAIIPCSCYCCHFIYIYTVVVCLPMVRRGAGTCQPTAPALYWTPVLLGVVLLQGSSRANQLNRHYIGNMH